MKQTNDVFELIKTMSKSEKRYFKLISSFHDGEKGYLKVFNILESQKKYSEKELHQKLEGEPFLKHISVTKNRLYHNLLSSLDQFKRSEAGELRNLLSKVEVLYQKELFKQAKKMLEKIKQDATHKEEFLILLEAHQWDGRIMRALSYKEESDESVENLYNNEKITLEKYARVCDYNKLNSQYFIHKQQQGNLLMEEYYKKIKTFAENAFLKNETLANSDVAKSYFYVLNASLNFTEKNYKVAYVNGKKLVELLESSAKKEILSSISYIHALHNLSIYQFHLKKFGEIEATLQKLRSLKTTNKRNEMLQFFFFSTMEMELSNYKADFSRADKTIKQIEKYLEENKNEFPNNRALLLYHLIMINLFVRGDIKKALRWNNKIINDYTTKVRADIYSFAQLFNLIIHLEIGNIDYVENRLPGHFLESKNENALYALWDILERFVKKCTKNNPTKKDYLQLKESLVDFSKTSTGNSALEYFDFIAWADSKIKNISLEKAIRLNQLVEKEADLLNK